MMAMRPPVFDKPIEEIIFSDIQNLKPREIAEGLYVEYKSDFQTSKKISHSIASFANTHGGWYFIGIKSDRNNVPEDFSGFDLSEHQKPKEKLRDVIVGNISPIPLFYSKLLEIGNNRGILIAYVPESYETPHVTKDGRIYRRNAEGSDPVPETDRYTIDKLYERGEKFDEIIEDFCRNEFIISKAQEHQGWLEIYFLTYPLNKLFIQGFFEKEYINEINNFFKDSIKLYKVISMGIPFDNISTSLNSLILRQTTPETLPYLTLTFQYFRNGSAKIIIPLEYLDVFDLPEIYESSKSIERLSSMLKDEDLLHRVYKIVDGWKLYNACMILVGKYVELLRKSGWEDFILARYRLVNTCRHILFFDSEAYTHHLDNFGPPICLKDESDIPHLPTRNFIKTEMPDENTGLSGQFAYVVECLGFHPMVFAEMTKDWISYLKKMQQKK